MRLILQNKLDHRSTMAPGTKFTSLPILANKFSLEHSHVYLFMYCVWLCSYYNDKLNSCDL